MILHGSEKISETICGTIQEALKKELLKKGTQITESADYSLLITFMFKLKRILELLQYEWSRWDIERTLS